MNNLKTQWGLITNALIFALPLLALKAVFHFITALVADVFFVIGIILSGILADFKKSEKMSGELTPLSKLCIKIQCSWAPGKKLLVCWEMSETRFVLLS